MSTLNELFQLEQAQAAEGRWPIAVSADQELFLAEARDRNARRCEALALQGQGDSLLRARALHLRGQFAQASELLQTRLTDASTGAERAELLLERAKIANSRGLWSEALSTIDEALEAGPMPLSRLTLHQMRAISWFESGEMMRAMEDLRCVDALSHTYPRCLGVFYARILEARIVARDLGPDAGIQLLERQWSLLPDWGMDGALTLLRADTDILRVGGLPHLRSALATYLLSQALGDRLYSGLALVDCYGAASEADQRLLLPRVQTAAREFDRVRTSWKQLEPSRAPGSDLPDNWESSRFIFLRRQDLLLQLDPWTVHSIEKVPQISKALFSLADGPISKEEFFHAVWGSQKYAARIHDTLISSLLHRIRKKFQLPLTIQENRVCAPEVLLLS